VDGSLKAEPVRIRPVSVVDGLVWMTDGEDGFMSGLPHQRIAVIPGMPTLPTAGLGAWSRRQPACRRSGPAWQLLSGWGKATDRVRPLTRNLYARSASSSRKIFVQLRQPFRFLRQKSCRARFLEELRPAVAIRPRFPSFRKGTLSRRPNFLWIKTNPDPAPSLCCA
jgi:hypothetical protein